MCLDTARCINLPPRSSPFFILSNVLVKLSTYTLMHMFMIKSKTTLTFWHEVCILTVVEVAHALHHLLDLHQAIDHTHDVCILTVIDVAHALHHLLDLDCADGGHDKGALSVQQLTLVLAGWRLGLAQRAWSPSWSCRKTHTRHTSLYSRVCHEYIASKNGEYNLIFEDHLHFHGARKITQPPCDSNGCDWDVVEERLNRHPSLKSTGLSVMHFGMVFHEAVNVMVNKADCDTGRLIDRNLFWFELNK